MRVNIFFKPGGRTIAMPGRHMAAVKGVQVYSRGLHHFRQPLAAGSNKYLDTFRAPSIYMKVGRLSGAVCAFKRRIGLNGYLREMSSNPKNNAVEIVIDSKYGYERVAMACVASFGKMLGFSDERIEDLKTVVAEAAVNAMQHGNKDRPDAKVAISMNFKDEALHISVTDNGGGIPELPSEPDIDRIVERLDPPTGFGTFLIKHLADEVEFNEITDGGHRVKMTIRL